MEKPNIFILSTCIDDWGGSEDLWAKSIPFLHEKNFTVTLLKNNLNENHPQIFSLACSGVGLRELNPFREKNAGQRFILKIRKKALQVFKIQEKTKLEKYLFLQKPKMVIISQGINFDGLHYAKICSDNNVPYVVLSQKAVEFYWPAAQDREFMRETFKAAKKCFFVSHQNLRLTEEQFGLRFLNAEVISNPIKKGVRVIPYPAIDSGFHLACIGRLFILDKGQDILLRILAKKKWKERNLSISFIGTGPDLEGLQSMAKLLEVENIRFLGYVGDPERIWKEHHALVLPSRSEGLPLVVLEAMASGRMVIATTAGGSDEVVQYCETGFIGDATIKDFELVLEKAWNNRESWEIMGLKASAYVKENLPASIEADFADTITTLINEY